MKRKFNVVLLFYLDPKPDRDRMQGIHRFVLTHPEWNVLLLPNHPANRSLISAGDWKIDGIITNSYTLTHFTDGDLTCWKDVKNLVVFDPERQTSLLPQARQVLIENDSSACGHLAANYFLRHGFKTVAYVHMLVHRYWSDERCEAFCETARAQGADTFVYDVPKTRAQGWAEEEARLADWIRSLPKPCGILGANDMRAMQIIQVCNCIGVSIPDQVSVMGVDNHDIACKFMRPSLTTIEPNNEQAGYLAAQTLHAMMTGRKKDGDYIRYAGNPHVIERDSTLDMNGTARILARAKEFVSDYYASDVDVTDIARAAGVSRRTLERRFSAVGKGSPLDLLQATRVAAMKRLLEETSDPINEIELRCGFKTGLRAKAVFKSVTGLTMSEYRKRSRA